MTVNNKGLLHKPEGEKILQKPIQGEKVLLQAMLGWGDPASYLFLEQNSGKFFQVYKMQLLEMFKDECSGICGHRLTRPHFTCLFTCRPKKVLAGQIPAFDEVTPNIILYRKNRPRWKKLLSRRVASLLEWLAT